MINRYEQEYYRNIGRIADALEKLVHWQILKHEKENE